jgi:hypothetical protein
MKIKSVFIGCFLLLSSSVVWAGEVEIVNATFARSAIDWSASVTLRHADTGWKHFADAWRIVDESGKELGKRVLHHPHENEQPFTRSLHNIKITPETRFVYIEAHDNVHGWSKQRRKVQLDHVTGRGGVVASAPKMTSGKKKEPSKESGKSKQAEPDKEQSGSK